FFNQKQPSLWGGFCSASRCATTDVSPGACVPGKICPGSPAALARASPEADAGDRGVSNIREISGAKECHLISQAVVSILRKSESIMGYRPAHLIEKAAMYLISVLMTTEVIDYDYFYDGEERTFLRLIEGLGITRAEADWYCAEALMDNAVYELEEQGMVR